MTDADCLASVCNTFAGYAGIWWVNQSKSVHDWPTFERVFLTTFGDNKHDGTWVKETANDTQASSETAAVYLQRMDYRANRLINKMPIGLQISVAYRGLRQEIKNALSEIENETWPDFCARVSRLESERFETMNRYSHSNNNTLSSRSHDKPLKFCKWHGKCLHTTSDCRSHGQPFSNYSPRPSGSTTATLAQPTTAQQPLQQPSTF